MRSTSVLSRPVSRTPCQNTLCGPNRIPCGPARYPGRAVCSTVEARACCALAPTLIPLEFTPAMHLPLIPLLGPLAQPESLHMIVDDHKIAFRLAQSVLNDSKRDDLSAAELRINLGKQAVNVSMLEFYTNGAQERSEETDPNIALLLESAIIRRSRRPDQAGY
ncbi:hypothetical protein B0H12DRAFT_1074752 [Mycena haematopus]|nr:hypothetical protein B0H12DRAFT_1074752 [Mycena haematopus]